VGEPIVISIQGGDVQAALNSANEKFNTFLTSDK
jgi:hypothetical protein